jgi:phosphate transport system protein
MRDAFYKELEALDQEIVRMGALVERSTQMAVTALVEGDLQLAQRVRADDNEIDAVFLDIEKRALLMLAQQSPVARDLRLIVAILRISTDLERVGDLTYNIAKLVQVDGLNEPALRNVRSLVSQLGTAASELIGRAIDAWVTKDIELAADISRQDDRLDDLHAQLIMQLLELKGEDNLGPALRLAMIGRYFERIGDHAVNLAERLRYLVTGDEELLA